MECRWRTRAPLRTSNTEIPWLNKDAVALAAVVNARGVAVHRSAPISATENEYARGVPALRVVAWNGRSSANDKRVHANSRVKRSSVSLVDDGPARVSEGLLTLSGSPADASIGNRHDAATVPPTALALIARPRLAHRQSANVAESRKVTPDRTRNIGTWGSV